VIKITVLKDLSAINTQVSQNTGISQLTSENLKTRKKALYSKKCPRYLEKKYKKRRENM